VQLCLGCRPAAISANESAYTGRYHRCDKLLVTEVVLSLKPYPRCIINIVVSPLAHDRDFP